MLLKKLLIYFQNLQEELLIKHSGYSRHSIRIVERILLLGKMYLSILAVNSKTKEELLSAMAF